MISPQSPSSTLGKKRENTSGFSSIGSVPSPWRSKTSPLTLSWCTWWPPPSQAPSPTSWPCAPPPLSMQELRKRATMFIRVQPRGPTRSPPHATIIVPQNEDPQNSQIMPPECTPVPHTWWSPTSRTHSTTQKVPEPAQRRLKQILSLPSQ